MTNHFVPMLGSLKVTAVLPLHIRRVVNTLQAQGLAPVTIKNYVRILGASFQCAIDAGLIRENPVDGVKVPRTPPTKFTVIDRADIPAFIAAAMETPYPYELLLMFYTGLRVGELRGLQWGDCDLDVGTMSVERQLHPVRHDLKRFTAPKYGEVRTIHLTEEAPDAEIKAVGGFANPELLDKSWMLAVTKCDLITEKEAAGLEAELSKNTPVMCISAVTNWRLTELKDKLWELLQPER